MTREELLQLIAEVQRFRSELDDVEVKSAKAGTPKRLFEPLSAFSNRIGGGVILFGLDEEQDFKVVGVGDAQRLQEGISDLASAEMEPALRPEFTMEQIDGETGLIEQHGTRRWAYYTLKAPVHVPGILETETDEGRILAYVRQNGSITNRECRDLLGVDLQRASRLLKRLRARGQLKREGERRWARYSWPGG